MLVVPVLPEHVEARQVSPVPLFGVLQYIVHERRPMIEILVLQVPRPF
jgi:hypothetical protein